MTLAVRRAATAYAFLGIPLVFFVGVRFGPMLYMIAMSLTDWGLLRKTLHFVGLANYAAIFADPVFLKSLVNTAKYAIFGAPVVIVQWQNGRPLTVYPIGRALATAKWPKN